MDGYSRVVGICGLLQMPDPNAGDLLRKKCNPSNESTPHDSQISSTTEPSDVKEVTHAIYAVYMIHPLFEFLLKKPSENYTFFVAVQKAA